MSSQCTRSLLVACLAHGRRVLIEGTVEHMVNTVHFDHRPGSTLNVCRGFFVNPVVFRYDLMPAINDLVFRCIRIPVFQIIVFESFRLLIVNGITSPVFAYSGV